MKVKAKTNIKYGLGWYSAGEEFEMKEADLATLGGLVEAVGKPAARPAPKTEEKQPEAEAPDEQTGEPEEAAKAKNARRKKTAE